MSDVTHQFSLGGALRRRKQQDASLSLPRLSGEVAEPEKISRLDPDSQPITDHSKTDQYDWFQDDTEIASGEIEKSTDIIDISAQPIHAGICRLRDYVDTGSGGWAVKFDILDQPTDAPHPFRGIKTGNNHGQRVKLMVCTAADDINGEPVAIYNGEAIVKWWSEDPRGLHIHFKLDDGPDSGEKHPFDGFEIGDTGQLVTLGCWALTEDHTIVNSTPKRGFNRLTPTSQSQILCKSDHAFQAFCVSLAPSLKIDLDPVDAAELNAAKIVYAFCGVQSRSELRSNQAAATKWTELLSRFRRRSIVAS